MQMRHVCKFNCHDCEHEFVLPRQSPLGISEGERYQATDRWPLDFLCWRHGQMCLVGLESIHLDTVPALPLGFQLASLWGIEVECANKRCGLHRAIYTKRSADETPSAVAQLVFSIRPLIDCPAVGGAERHRLQFDYHRMRAVRFEP